MLASVTPTQHLPFLEMSPSQVGSMNLLHTVWRGVAEHISFCHVRSSKDTDEHSFAPALPSPAAQLPLNQDRAREPSSYIHAAPALCRLKPIQAFPGLLSPSLSRTNAFSCDDRMLATVPPHA
eukprot:3742415-Rhodomonas_salina.1